MKCFFGSMLVCVPYFLGAMQNGGVNKPPAQDYDLYVTLALLHQAQAEFTVARQEFTEVQEEIKDMRQQLSQLLLTHESIPRNKQ